LLSFRSGQISVTPRRDENRDICPRTAMRYVKPSDAAVAEVTSLLGPPRDSH
jgi:hypothetical protein